MITRRVVITGMGILAPNGNGKEAYWDALINGRSGIKRIASFDPSPFNTQIAGEVKTLIPAIISIQNWSKEVAGLPTLVLRHRRWL